MSERHASLIAAELSLPPARVRAVASLLQGGATLPFIARYRKEATGFLSFFRGYTTRQYFQAS